MTHHGNLEPYRPSRYWAGPPAEDEYYDPVPLSYLDNDLVSRQQDPIWDLRPLARYEPQGEIEFYDDVRRVKPRQSPPDPGVVIVLFMLALVTVVAIVAIVAVLSMAANAA